MNPNLAGADIPCPSCGAGVRVPEARSGRKRAKAAPPPPPPNKRKRRRIREPYSAWLFAAQTVIVLLGLATLTGAFFQKSWNPPVWSFFRENPLVLVAVGVGLLVAAGVARALPVLTTLGTAVVTLGACALHYRIASEVDASRVLALAGAMLALWLALQHKRAVRR